LLNGKPIFQRLVLDQGFYPDGIYTAPTDEALKHDIELSQAAGFNGARLHQKVFEERFLYWADHLGYIVWGEHASWGLDTFKENIFVHFLPEWREIVQRDYNHPSIVGWCPFNETWSGQNNEAFKQLYYLTKALDPQRPVIDSSGYRHVISDVLDCHDYNQDPASFRAYYADMQKDTARPRHWLEGAWGLRCDEKAAQELLAISAPYFVSEYGGTWWNEEQRKTALEEKGGSWGYGEKVKSLEHFYERIGGLTKALLDNPRVCAFCYTQLTDVEQEQNGIYYYDRSPKFDPERIRAIFSAPAAIEE
jgi:hypothetical protein